MMRRKALWICLIMMTLALIPAIKPVQAPSVTSLRWVAPVYSGSDSYHGTTVTAYTQGTDATLIVKVYNNLPKAPFNVYVHMDWATSNVTAGEVEVPKGQWHTFKISIPIPTEASIEVLHDYRILVKYEDRTTTPTTIGWLGPYTGPPYIAAYSADQTEAQLSKQEYQDWRNSYTPSTWLGLTSKAKELWVKGAVEKSAGDNNYQAGSFSDAKTHYGNALNYTKEAITADIEKTASLEDALIGLVDAGKSFLSMQGYAYMIASIGFLFMGIGAMIYLIRRSSHPVT